MFIKGKLFHIRDVILDIVYEASGHDTRWTLKWQGDSILKLLY